MSGKLVIVPHAVERYRERWAPLLSTEEARADLHRIAQDAKRTKRRTSSGEELWTAAADDKILFVIKRDQGNPNPICVTVLPRGAFEQPGIQDMAEFLEYQQDREAENLRIKALLAADSPPQGRLSQSEDYYTYIVFLDFDGVLNNRDFRLRGGLPDDRIDPKNVAVLNEMLDRRRAGVVVCSTWRINKRVIELQDLLQQRGFTGRVVGKTPHLTTPDASRGLEIQEWLKHAPRAVRSFVIFDDESVDGKPLQRHLVRVSSETGLEKRHAEHALKILNSV